MNTYTLENLIFAVIGGFVAYPVLKFFALALWEKTCRDMKEDIDRMTNDNEQGEL